MSGFSKFIAAALAGLLQFASPALAQDAPDPPQVVSPLRSEPDPNGVNLLDGTMEIEPPVMLSAPADPRLTFDRVQNSAPYITGVIPVTGPSLGTSSWSAHVGGEQAVSFQCVNDDVCHDVKFNGSVFFFGAHDVRLAGSGAYYHFNLLSSNVTGSTQTTQQYYASSIVYPDGEVISFTYDTGSIPGDQFHRTFYRPTKISSNTGYYITVSYQYSGTDVTQPGWGEPLQAALFSPSAALIRRLVYGTGTITDYGNNASDTGGRTFTVSGVSNTLGGAVEVNSGSIQLPGESTTQLSVTPDTSNGITLIASIVRDGVDWSYSYANRRLTGTTSFVTYDSVSVTGPNGYHVTYAISASRDHNLINSRTDALGHTTSYSYDDAKGDRLTGITSPEGNSVSVQYDICGNVNQKTTTEKPSAGSATLVESATFAVNPSGGTEELRCPDVNANRPLTYTDARGNTANYTNNAGGQRTQELAPADSAGVRPETDTSYADSASGLSRKTEVRVCGQTTTCSGHAQSRTDLGYFASGDQLNTALPLTVTQRDEATSSVRTTTYTYDAAGRPTVIDGPLSGTGDARYFQYDPFGRKIWEVGEIAPSRLRLAKKFTYRDSDDKVIKVESGNVACGSGCDTVPLTLTLLQQTDTIYDGRRYPIRDKTYKTGMPLTVTDRSFLDRGLAECSTVRMNMASLPSSTSHGACALGTEGAEGPDRITKNSYDDAGELTTVQKAYLTADQADYATYTYTPNGKQEYVTDANGNKARFVYDGFDRLSQWQFPSKATPGTVDTADFEQYAYDPNGNRTSLRKRDAQTINYSYDALNRMVSKGGSTLPNIAYTYDVAGRQLTAKFSTGGQGITNVYNAFGDVTSTTSDMGGTARTISSAYDTAGRRSLLTYPDALGFRYFYDNLSRLTQIATANRVDTFTYGDNGLLASRTEVGGSSATYAWDDIDRLTSQTDAFTGGTGNVTWSLGYNPASQIAAETRSNDSYAWTGAVSGSQDYTTNGLNQYTAVGASSLTYDDNGNLTSDGTWTYGYDAENRLISAAGAGKSATLSYDPLGRLWKIGGTGVANTLFLYDGDALIAEYSVTTGAMTNRYVHGSNAAADDPLLWYIGDTKANLRYIHADHLGSPVAYSDDSGTRTDVNRYDEYGVPASTNVGRFGFTGQAWLSELGLYYYKARMYSAGLGRFLQTDPVGYEGGVNLYAYVGDDPVNEDDPTGEAGVVICTGSNIGKASNCAGGGLAAGASGSSTGGITGRIESAASNAIKWVKKNPGKTAIGAAVVVGTVVCIIAQPCGFGEAAVGAGVEGAEAASAEGALSEEAATATNPFMGKSPEQIDKMLRSRGFQPRGPDPLNGKGDYLNPRTGRSFHIDEANRFGEEPHVDANRPKTYRGPLEKKKFPMGGNW